MLSLQTSSQKAQRIDGNGRSLYYSDPEVDSALRTTLITAALLVAGRLLIPAGFSAATTGASLAVPTPKVTISTPNLQYKTVDEVGIDFKLRNTGRAPVYVQVPYERGHLCRIMVTDKRTGAEVIVKYPRGPWRRVLYRPVRVDPHFFYGRTINLGRFDPGTYELQVRYDSHPATAPEAPTTGMVLFI